MKNIMRKVAVVGVAACFAAVGLVGCGQQEEAQEEPAIEEQQPAYDLVIGAESEEVVHLPVLNGTEQSIVGMQFKLIDAPEFSANIMATDQVWEAGQTADIFFDGVAVEEEGVPQDGEGEADEAAVEDAMVEASEAGTDFLLNEVYDIQFTTADGTAIVLHQLSLTGLANAADIKLMYDAASGFGYLTYMENDAEVSTLESEQHIAAAAAAVAQAEAEAVAAAEAEAAAQAEAEAAAAQQSRSRQSYSGGSGSYSGGYDSVSSGSGGGSAPSQTEDACINPDDLALN